MNHETFHVCVNNRVFIVQYDIIQVNTSTIKSAGLCGMACVLLKYSLIFTYKYCLLQYLCIVFALSESMGVDQAAGDCGGCKEGRG